MTNFTWTAEDTDQVAKNNSLNDLPGNSAPQRIFTSGYQNLCQANEHWPLVALQEPRRLLIYA